MTASAAVGTAPVRAPIPAGPSRAAGRPTELVAFTGAHRAPANAARLAAKARGGHRLRLGGSEEGVSA